MRCEKCRNKIHYKAYYDDTAIICDECMEKKAHLIWDYTEGMKCCRCGCTECELSEYEGELFCETCLEEEFEKDRVYRYIA